MAKITVSPAKSITLTLELNEREARVLCTVMGKVCGKPEGPRGLITQIFDTLDNAGYYAFGLGSGQINLPDDYSMFEG